MEKCWDYFPPKALAVLEWGHYLGLPSLLMRKLTGRWILIPSYWNLALTYRYLQPYSNAVPCEDGVCTFYIARRIKLKVVVLRLLRKYSYYLLSVF